MPGPFDPNRMLLCRLLVQLCFDFIQPHPLRAQDLTLERIVALRH